MSDVLDRINKRVEAAYKELDNQHKIKIKKLPRLLQPIDVTHNKENPPVTDISLEVSTAAEEDTLVDKISLEDLDI
jgi:hypothetical protein